MGKKQKFNKKGFKKRLAAMLMIYMDGLNEKKRKKMDEYLDKKLTVMVNYYVNLRKGKNGKKVMLTIPGENMIQPVQPAIMNEEDKPIHA